MLRVPPKNSNRHIICLALYQHGDMTAAQMRAVQTSLSTDSIHQALKGAAETGYVTRVGNVYILKPHVAEHFAEVLDPKELYVGQVAAPRTFIVNRELKSLPTDVHAGRYREGVTFHNGSTDFRQLAGYQA